MERHCAAEHQAAKHTPPLFEHPLAVSMRDTHPGTDSHSLRPKAAQSIPRLLCSSKVAIATDDAEELAWPLFCSSERGT